MRDAMKRMKVDVILSAALCTALGVVLLVWPAQTIDIFCKVLAVGLIILGVVDIVSYFMNRSIHPFAGVLGLMVLLVGAWVFFKPESIVSIIPIVIGVILLVHGIQDFKLAFETKENGYDKWWSMFIIAAISIILGAVCIVNAFGVVKLALQFIGVALIYDGISDLWIASRAIRAARDMKREADALDVEYKEVEDDEQN